MSHALLILEIDTIGPFDVTSWEAASDDDVVHKTDVDRVVDGVTCRWRCVVVPRSRSENPLGCGSSATAGNHRDIDHLIRRRCRLATGSGSGISA